jgi:hypothetical protein
VRLANAAIAIEGNPDYSAGVIPTLKAKIIWFVAGVLITLLVLFPILRDTTREQRWGLLMSPEEVKLNCGTPQADDGYKLKYVTGDRSVELQFFDWNHKFFLNRVTWNSPGESGSIYKVSLAQITQSVADGKLPVCLQKAAE